jgi:hypothetical protein
MAKNIYCMHKKDYRIRIRNSEIDANPDYVAISNVDAELVAAGKKPGLLVLREILHAEQELEFSKAASELQTLSMKASAPPVEEDAEEFDPDTAREDDQLPPNYATMRSKDLDAIAVSRGIAFAPGMKRSEKVDRLLQP